MSRKQSPLSRLTSRAALKKHAIVGVFMTLACVLLAITGGFRSADRADGLAVSAIVGGTLGEEGPVPESVNRAWNNVRTTLGHANLQQLLALPERPPITVDVSGPSEVVEQAAVDAVRRAGFEPVAPGVPSFGVLSMAVSRAPGARMSVAVGWQPRTGEKVEAAGARIAGPWWSVLPPLLAVLLALFYGRALFALGAAVLLGAALVHGDPFSAVFELFAYLWGAVSDSFRLYIIGFTLALVGMVQVASRSGGNQGLIDLVSRFAKNARSTRIATAMMGLAIFFDDYANTLVVGTSARPLTDRMKISREKLAYIVDSTAAPVAGLAIISTWVGYEVGLFDALSTELNLGSTGFEIFLAVLPSRFYCILALVFVFANTASARDYGPMLKAERRAARGGSLGGASSKRLDKLLAKVAMKKGAPARWQNAALPIGVTLLGVVVGMVLSAQSLLAEAGEPAADLGTFDGWRIVFSNGDSGIVLFGAAVIGSLTAIGLAVGQRILNVREAVAAWLAGTRVMGSTLAILVFAWAMQAVTEDLGTSYYLVSVLEPILSPGLLPFAVFAAAAAVAFATGTSWGTMGILLPALIPLAWFMTGDLALTLLCMGAVLDGAIFGDHCSPISDTTVMSSIAAGCDHVTHVKTQMPYALTVMVIAAGFGYLGVPLGLPVMAAYALGLAAIAGVFVFVAKPIDATA